MGEQLIQLECCDLGYRLFGKDRPGWSGGGVILYMRNHYEPDETRQVNVSDNVVGVCYRLLDEEAEMGEDFFRQLEDISHLHILVLIRDFNHPGIC